MRELTWDLFVTIDGKAKGTRSPAYFGYDGPELGAWIDEQVLAPHVMLMGATTYRVLSGVADVGGAPDDPAARRMTELGKVVFSRTLTEALSWPNTTVIREDAVAAVSAMKGESGDPLRVIGSLSLGRSLLAHGLVDRYRLVVFPQVLGSTGAEPAFESLPDLRFELRSSTVLDGRLVVLDYAPPDAGGSSKR